MGISAYFKVLATVGIRRVASSFIAVFGTLWLLIEPIGLFRPGLFEFGWCGYLALAFASLIVAVILRFPRRAMSRELSGPDSSIEIKVGDLFEEPHHLVIGTTDVFDTELGEVIKTSSVQGQFLTRIYSGDRARLDTEIEEALEPYNDKRKEYPHKSRGKRWRYPIGTTITLGLPGRRYFLVAYGCMGRDLKCTSDSDSIWRSLSKLWEEIRLKGQGTPVAIPVIGSDLARTGLPRMALLKMIILSFIVASKKQFVVKELTIVIWPDDLNSVNLYDLKDFLASVCF